MLDSTVLSEVEIQVSGYFRDFFESDFKKQSAPRRRILLQSSEGFRCGMRPDGQCKFPRLWPPQTPPGKDVGIMTVRR